MRATVKSIADAIIDLVERADRPVTLAQLASRIPDFRMMAQMRHGAGKLKMC